MSFESQRSYLGSRMKQVDTGLPMAFPNVKFDRPKDAPYGEFHIMGGDFYYKEIMGASPTAGMVRVKVCYTPMLQMTIWIPEEGKEGPATRAADALHQRFANRQGFDDSGDFYRFKTVQPITPQSTKQGWKAYIFRIPFTRDTIEEVPIGLTL
jgi:hypothetical protein